MPSPRTAVRIAARQPLLRAGLERIAHAADVDVSESRDADFVLRAGDSPADSCQLDVAIFDGVCVITCTSRPVPAVWEAVGRIVDAAADSR